MIGVFDSGLGGENALAALRKKLPRADIVLYADREHLPYGTKSEGALLPLIERDIDILRSAGAEKILVACCTASTLYDRLPDGYRTGVFPILDVVADAAVRHSRRHRYAVLATTRTVRSGAFSERILQRDPAAHVRAIAAGELVPLAEERVTDPADARLYAVIKQIAPVVADADTVVLGCTHFSVFKDAFRRIFPGKTWIGSAEEGAGAFAETLTRRDAAGGSRTVRL